MSIIMYLEFVIVGASLYISAIFEVLVIAV